MSSVSDLDNGLPRYYSDAEIAQMKDRLLQPDAEPSSEPSSGHLSEPSSGDVVEPNSDDRLPPRKPSTVDIDYKRQAVGYLLSGKNKHQQYQQWQKFENNVKSVKNQTKTGM